MASISSRPLTRLALQSHISGRSIASAQTAAPAKAALRRYTSTSLTSFRAWSKVSQTRTSNCQKPFNLPVTTTYLQNRGYAELKASGGKTEADLIVEELQELCYSLPNTTPKRDDGLTVFSKGTKTPKTNSKSQQTAPTAPPSTPPPTTNPRANSSINSYTSTTSTPA